MNMFEIKKLHAITPAEIRLFEGCPEEDDATVRAWFRSVFEAKYPNGPEWDSNPDMKTLNGYVGVYRGMYKGLHA